MSDVPPTNKKLDRKYAEHLAGLLRPIVRDRFGNSQTAFAKHVGVSQPQISAILRPGGGDRSAGISVLIRLRAYLNMSIDEMLGLPMLPARAVPVSELEAAVARALERRFPQPEATRVNTDLPPLHSPKRKKLE